MEKDDVQKFPGPPRRKKHSTVTMIAMQILWRLKIASLAILISIGLFLKAIGMWVVGLIQAGVSFGLHSGPLFEAAGNLVSSIFLTPVRVIVAITFIFGIPLKWLEIVLPSILKYTKTQPSSSKDETLRKNERNIIADLQSQDAAIRAEAMTYLAMLKDLDSVTLLIPGLRDEDRMVRLRATEALAWVTGQDFGEDEGKWNEWWARNKPVQQSNPGDEK
jgi:hypothetical protein